MRAALKRLIQFNWMKELGKKCLLLALLALLFPKTLLLRYGASFFVCLNFRFNFGLPLFPCAAGLALRFGNCFCLHCPASHARIGAMLGDDVKEETDWNLACTW